MFINFIFLFQRLIFHNVIFINYFENQDKETLKYRRRFAKKFHVVLICNLQQVTARQVQSSLIPILQTFHERSLYLNCLVNPATPSLALLHAGLNTSEQKNIDDKEQKKPSEGTLRFVPLFLFIFICFTMLECHEVNTVVNCNKWANHSATGEYMEPTRSVWKRVTAHEDVFLPLKIFISARFGKIRAGVFFC